MFYTGLHIPITFKNIPDAILRFYNKHKELGEINIIIGTDSQNFHDTKLVSVIAVTCEGHGGIYFYEITRFDLLRTVKEKLHTETQESLTLAEKLIDALESDNKYTELLLSCPISIHVDAGNSDKGKTKQLIPELIGWVKACGYDVHVKPESFVASSIADKLSK